MLKTILICTIATLIYAALTGYFVWDYRRQTSAEGKAACHIGPTIVSFSILYFAVIVTVVRLFGEGLFRLL